MYGKANPLGNKKMGDFNEAAGGFEPPHRSFADCSLTTWVRRRMGSKRIQSTQSSGMNANPLISLLFAASLSKESGRGW